MRAPGHEIAGQRAFGSAFASALETVPPGRWTGPIASAYGAHLVWVHERRGGQLPGLEEVKGQVLHHYLRTRRAELLRASLDELRSRYTIRVELPARAAS
jgi:parvulin-like peptidyl-prolyl isomerase